MFGHPQYKTPFGTKKSLELTNLVKPPNIGFDIQVYLLTSVSKSTYLNGSITKANDFPAHVSDHPD